MPKLLWTIKQHIGPQPRAAHAMAFDSQRRRTVLFGGDSLQATLFGDTWEWDGESWTQMNDIGPGPRAGLALAYDATRQRTVLFGGRDASGMLADTWEWDGEDWTQVADTGPAARIGHAMVFDSRRNRVLLFGGDARGALRNDSWEWDGEEWVQVEDTGPAARRDHAMAYDATRNRTVLFGGTTATDAFGDTWEWDGAVWAQLSSFGPPPVLGATMISTQRRNLIFGGVSAPTGTPVLFGNSWEWDGRHWTIRQDMGPGPRWDHAMIFDSARGRGVLFGGTSTAPGAAPPLVVLNDTWEQFERSPASPAGPGEAARLQGVSVSPPQPIEGEAFTIQFLLSGPASAPAVVNFTVRGPEGTVGSDELTIDPGTDRAELQAGGGLFPGVYQISATLGEVTVEAEFEVLVRDSPQLQSLVSDLATVPPGQSFTLTATLNSPAPTQLIVPLRIMLPDETMVMAGIPIAAGSPTGNVNFNSSELGPSGTLEITGRFGGAEANVTVTLT